MGLVIQVSFLVLAALVSVLVCGGLLRIVSIVLPLARQQRAALWGVGQTMTEAEFRAAMAARGFEPRGPNGWWIVLEDGRRFGFLATARGYFDQYQQAIAARVQLARWFGHGSAPGVVARAAMPLLGPSVKGSGA